MVLLLATQQARYASQHLNVPHVLKEVSLWIRVTEYNQFFELGMVLEGPSQVTEDGYELMVSRLGRETTQRGVVRIEPNEKEI